VYYLLTPLYQKVSSFSEKTRCAIIIVLSMIARDVATRRAGLHTHSRI
jgi:hypothetical protein